MPQRPLEARNAVSAPSAHQPDAAFSAGVSFRGATGRDVPALVAMINAAYLRETWLPPPRITEPALREDLRRPAQSMVVGEIRGDLCGCVRVKFEEDNTWFGLLAVAPAFQGRGLASMLIERAEGLARNAGRDTMRLDCAKEVGMPPFYASLGYEVEREVPDSYYSHKGPFTLVILKNDLR
jgi:ribosomal protein S18 acetylase RimI-like enzyme